MSQRACDLINGRASTGHVGHQFSHAPGRPILHLFLSSRRPRRVSQRTGIINQIRAFLLERGLAVRQGLHFLRAELPGILAGPSDALSPRMVRIIEDLGGDWRRLDERIEGLSNEIEAIARRNAGCERLISVPGVGPIISARW
jgi:transposase